MNLPVKRIALIATALLSSAHGVLAQSSDVQVNTSGGVGGAIGGLFGLLVAVIVIAGMWKVFTKAGQPGWASIVPIYNAYIICKIAGKPGW